MEIDTQATSSFGATATSSQTKKTPDANTDFQTFLTLLTTQMKNQDPMKPMDSTEFVAQLASFSAVEQQIQTNLSLTAIQDLLSGADPASLASWIGMEIRAPIDASFSGAPVQVFSDPSKLATHASLLVRDAAGATVQTQRLPLGATVIEWAGVSQDGSPIPNGEYSFEIESYSDKGLLETHKASIYAMVKEVRTEAGQTVLVTSDGAQVSSDLVTSIRKSDG